MNVYHYLINHIIEYLLVYLVFAAGIWTLFSSNNPMVKLVIILGLGGIYFVWAVWHHLDDHTDFDFSVMLEYVSMLILVMWILFSLL